MTNKMRSKTNNNTDLMISLWSQRLRPEDWDFKASLCLLQQEIIMIFKIMVVNSEINGSEVF